MKNNNKGFTLIELLVVIAIIGVLSSVVLASLNTARSKGNDASIKANLRTILTQAVLYYDNNNGYSTGASNVSAAAGTTGGCVAASNSIFNDPNVAQAIIAADKAAGGSGNTKVTCAITAATAPAKVTAWSVTSPLVSATGYWCVDSAGNAKAEASAVTTTTCP